MSHSVICPYCGFDATKVTGEVIYPHREDLHHLSFWHCAPCDAYVGCHKPNRHHGYKGGEPMGRLANAPLRLAKRCAHRAFDPLWQENGILRGDAYSWLAKQLKIEVRDCHIGMFNLDTCNRVIEICNGRRGI